MNKEKIIDALENLSEIVNREEHNPIEANGIDRAIRVVEEFKETTVHEKFSLLTGHEEPIHIEALKTLMAELQENNPDIDFDWCLPKYKGIIEWLQSDSES